MARIEGTGQRADVRRVRIPKVRLDWAVLAVLLAPSLILAPEEWQRAVVSIFVIAGAWYVGLREGRAEMAREVLRGLRRDDGAA